MKKVFVSFLQLAHVVQDGNLRLAGLQEKTGKEFVLSSVSIIQSVC